MSEPIDDIVAISPDVHQVLFENDAIRLLEVTVKPGAKAEASVSAGEATPSIEMDKALSRGMDSGRRSAR